MPNYRRAFVPGGSFFFTVNVHQRRPLFGDAAAVELLGSVFRRCLLKWPFTVNAIVLLPDHLHAIWTLPRNDAEYPKRWGWAKKEFTKHWLQIGGHDYEVSEGRRRQRRCGIWQPRYWEHTLQDADEFEIFFDYIHWNPVKHGYVRCPSAWPHSSFHRYVRLGVYDRRWGCFTAGTSERPLDFRAIEGKAGEV
jgi:putative transposase